MTTALLVIDVQREMEFRTRTDRDRANPQAEERVVGLLAIFRARGLPVIHVQHDQPDPPVAFGRPGGAVMPCAAPLSGESVLIKSASLAFTGTGLARICRRRAPPGL